MDTYSIDALGNEIMKILGVMSGSCEAKSGHPQFWHSAKFGHPRF